MRSLHRLLADAPARLWVLTAALLCLGLHPVVEGALTRLARTHPAALPPAVAEGLVAPLVGFTVLGLVAAAFELAEALDARTASGPATPRPR